MVRHRRMPRLTSFGPPGWAARSRRHPQPASHHLWLLGRSTAPRAGAEQLRHGSRSPSDDSAALNREAPRSLRALPDSADPSRAISAARDALPSPWPRCCAAPSIDGRDRRHGLRAVNRGALRCRDLESDPRTRAAVAAHLANSSWIARERRPGIETIIRLLLRADGTSDIASQVRILRVRRVDLLVGDRLVIEVDGAGFHSGEDFERDRIRDLRARPARLPGACDSAIGWC